MKVELVICMRKVSEFLEFAKRNGAGINGRCYCPCVNCLNGKRLDIELIREHVLCDGFLKNYTTWTWQDLCVSHSFKG